LKRSVRVKQFWNNETCFRMPLHIVLKDGKGFRKNLNIRIQQEKKGRVEMTSGEKFRPPVFDGANNSVPPSVIIGGGSRLKVRVTVNFYDGFGGGINLYINSIQLLKLSQTQFTSPFEKAEDGYVYGGSSEGGAEEDQRDHNDDADDGEESYAF